MTNIRERKHRLSSTLYYGEIVVSFTACIADRVPIFNSMEVFLPITQILLDSLNRWNCDAHVYLFMPDHCHLLVQGNTNNSDLLGFMKDFKQRSGYWLSKHVVNTQAKACAYHTVRWQKDFYDHILRKDEDINKQVYYILENPVRKGLVNDWKEYPFKGSTIHNFEKW